MARITRVRLENYKSIRSCDVRLEPLTVLVGKNGSGKSNFLDALAFTRDVLLENLENAIRRRGNFSDIARKDANGKAESFSITLEFDVNGESYTLFFRVGFNEKPMITEQFLQDSKGLYLYSNQDETLVDLTNHLGIGILNLKQKSTIGILLLVLQVFSPNLGELRKTQKARPNYASQLDLSEIDFL
jgi:DNA repair exonuclease SbcCD ATPase subunit